MQWKTYIARKSAYVEIIVYVDPGACYATTLMVYPLIIDINNRVPVPWNVAHLSMQKLPALDLSEVGQPDKRRWLDDFKWLSLHVSSTTSARENVLRHSPMDGGEHARAQLKATLLTILKHHAGFSFLVSKLRLDLSNRTVVLYAACLKLYDALPRPNDYLIALTENNGMEGNADKSLEDGQQVLCNCGNGVVPDGYMPSIPNFKSFVGKQCVRVALSLLFYL
ncbi:hypothetical protein B0T26DRAFT_747179 [Lasiosphaeria miniovina]|uniref:Uncharacterized protein n=1 Tax=Lasiosphaeria miniovina TaxID=1954250 RepID=A0AA40E6F2_9PEZI|nr:uncharacterized protein B0T26DRAFT_747179 [Lasiosphaeria miniovina]KAK0726772.1 hypothetical protein B0T26DRAFT_747179 [Lasiosphaeria miniovina]